MKRMNVSNVSFLAVAIMMVVLMLSNISPAFSQVEGPRYGGELIIGEDLGLGEGFNPNYDFTDHPAIPEMFNRLVKESHTTGEILPDLAYDWEVSEDYKTWTFYLYDNITWHDGVQFSSADVKWTFDSILEYGGGPMYFSVQNIESVETPDENTVILHLTIPDGVLLNKLVKFESSPIVLPKHLYEGTDPATNPYNHAPIGTGPFMYSAETTESYLVMVRNPNYFISELPYLDKIYERYIPDRATAVAAMEVGEIQATHVPMPLLEAQRLEANPNFRVNYVRIGSTYHLSFDMSQPPFDDVRVRKALAYAIDVDDINERMFGGGGSPMQTALLPLPEWVPNTDPDAQIPQYDPVLAEQLLDEAGFPRGTDGIRFSADFYSSSSLSFSDVAEIIDAHVAEVGIDLTVRLLDSATFNSKIYQNRDYEGMSISGGSPGWDPDGMRQFFHSEGFKNQGNYSNPRVDELFDLGLSSPDPAVRKVYYDEMQVILAEELPRYTFLNRIKIWISRTDYHGFYWEEEAGKQVAYQQINQAWWEGGELPPEPTPTPSPTPSPTPTPPGPGELPITELEQAIAALSSMVASFTSQVSALQDTVESLNSQIAMAEMISYIAVAISVIVVVIAIVVVFRRKQ